VNPLSACTDGLAVITFFEGMAFSLAVLAVLAIGILLWAGKGNWRQRIRNLGGGT
jgi:type IV secretory pathway VirB2 component (pilin)